MNKKIVVAALSWLMVVGVTTSGFSAGSVAHGDISVFKGGQLADKLSGQNPVDEGSLMVCDGKCMIKSKGVSLVAADQAKFAIQNEDSVFNLYVRGGQLNYVVNDNSRKIAFHTPDGSYSIAEVIFNAGSTPVVRGYVQVNEAGETEIGVSEGRMVFATADGMKTVDANHKIVLAIADIPTGTVVTGGGGIGTGTLIAGGVVVAGGITAAAVIRNNQKNDDPSPVVSPNN